MRTEGVGEHASLLPPLEDKKREARCVPTDRRLGGSCALVERPAGVARGALPVPGEESRLDCADRPPPAAGRRVGIALAVTVGGVAEPFRGGGAVPEHQEREARRAGGVAHPRQLSLARVGILRQSSLAVPVT